MPIRDRRKPNKTLRFESLESKRMLAGDDITSSDDSGLEVLVGDINGNRKVDFPDFLKMAKNFGATDAKFADGDVDGDSLVGFPDFLLIANNFGKSRAPANSGGNPGRRPGIPRGQLDSARFVQRQDQLSTTINTKRLLHGNPFAEIAANAEVVFYPVMQAGSASGTPADSPEARVDTNATTSNFGGVGSLEIVHPTLGTFICSGSVITSSHVLTAGHCFDLEVDGVLDAGITATFHLNDGSDFSSSHSASAITVHPDFGGFASSGANDDLAIVELSIPVPTSTQKYFVNVAEIAEGTTLELVGYGQSGNGDTGFTVLPSYTEKRAGKNQADLFVVDDETGNFDEIFLFDFDEPTGTNTGYIGGPTLGNEIETSFGGGDSGGPAFVEVDGERIIAGINTFNWTVTSTSPPVGFFGSFGGGIILAPYAKWIASIAPSSVPANQAPSFTAGPDQVSSEDAGMQTVVGWAKNISAGADEGEQSLAFNVTGNTNPSLFVSGPTIDSNGTLSYHSAANVNGSAEVTIELADDGGTRFGGVDTSPSQTFTITVLSVNDAPSFSLGGNVTVKQDSGDQTRAGHATNFAPGPLESEQAIDEFIATNDNSALFRLQPQIDKDGRLAFTPADGANGVATVAVQVRDDGSTANGGVDVSGVETFLITIEPNDSTSDPLEFALAGDVRLTEGDGARRIKDFVVKASRSVNGYVVANDSEHLFRVQPEIDSNGVLRFTPKANAFGSAAVKVQAYDNNRNSSPTQTFIIRMAPVNDAPSISLDGNVKVAQDAGKTVINKFATKFDPGNAFESDQNIDDFVLRHDNQELFSVQPDIGNNGQLFFAPAGGMSGVATVKVLVRDDGGTSNGGVNVSDVQTFFITIEPSDVHDKPTTFVLAGDVRVNEGDGIQRIEDFVVKANPSIKHFRVTNDNERLFRNQPEIDSHGRLRFAARVNAFGSAIVQVQARGNSDENAIQTFNIRIAPVNDAPSISLDGNVKVAQDAGKTVINKFATKFDPGNAFESGQHIDDFIVRNDNQELFRVQPDIGDDGQLFFAPADGMSGVALVAVQVRDSGGTRNGGQDTSAPKMFMIKVSANSKVDAPTAPRLRDFLQRFTDQVTAIDGFRQAEQLVARLAAAIEGLDEEDEDDDVREDDNMRSADGRLRGVENTLKGLIAGGQLSDKDGRRLLDILQAIRDRVSS